jgi:predicted Rossmann fold nucleotide-binding protein DprA/Smf involved in DNA uptake
MDDFHFGRDLSPDTRALLLLCARLEAPDSDDLQPLNSRECEQFLQWLRAIEIRPQDLLDSKGVQALIRDDVPIALPRVSALLERRAALAASIEEWANSGLWLISRVDPRYPLRFLDQAHFPAPPLLYGAGDLNLLSLGGLAIVGSRQADNEALNFTRDLARTCAHQGVVVVSGGAHGVDRTAMDTALEAGGRVVGTVANQLAKTAALTIYQDALRDGKLLLVSPYPPDTGFHIGNAMGRNKLIYACADWGLVVSASLEKGGTWAGAVEASKHGRHLFVRMQGTIPAGNRKLLELGARPFPEPWPRLVESLSGKKQAVRQDRQQTAYDLVLPLLLSYLDQPCDLPTLVHRLGVNQNQVKSWLKRAIKEGRIDKVEGLESPRYRLSRQRRMPFVAEPTEEYVASSSLALR